MKTSFICTILNEEQTIENLLDSISIQSKKPDEVVIVDAGSQDHTITKINSFRTENKDFGLKLLIKKGNRSVGRNEAIKKSSGDIVLSTDAGNILDRNWVKNITEPFKDRQVDVAAGYYDAKPKTVFQRCLIPYVFVMPDKVDPDNFLPATRSMAFKRSVWEEIGGFDERLSHNEDYAFARKIKQRGFKIKFARDAIVYWIPPNNMHRVFIMFFRFAYGDAEAGIYRPKAVFVIARYALGLALVLLAFYLNSIFLFIFIWVLLINYILWSILKNYYYIKDKKALIFLPILQFTSDIAVILGTTLGYLKRFK